MVAEWHSHPLKDGFRTSFKSLIIRFDLFLTQLYITHWQVHFVCYNDLLMRSRNVFWRNSSFDPRQIDGIQRMANLEIGAGLEQFVCPMQWMLFSILEFSTIISPFSGLLDKAYNLVGKMIHLAEEHLSFFLSNGLQYMTPLLISANDPWSIKLHWRISTSAIVSVFTLTRHISSGRLSLFNFLGSRRSFPCEKQRHEMLVFLSEHFTDSFLRCSTIEKRTYNIMTTVDRMHWLLESNCRFDLYTGHNNLIFRFDPISNVADISQTTLGKVPRWAVRLSAYTYTCIHVLGTGNFCADFLNLCTASRINLRLVCISFLPLSTGSDFEWPKSEGFLKAQTRLKDSKLSNTCLHTGSFLRVQDGTIWSSDEDSDLNFDFTQFPTPVAVNIGTQRRQLTFYDISAFGPPCLRIPKPSASPGFNDSLQ